jgi:hypothetical protein
MPGKNEYMNCKGKTHDQKYPYPSRPCTRKAWKDGYCKTHHPEEKSKRNKDRMDGKEKVFQNSRYKNVDEGDPSDGYVWPLTTSHRGK